MSKNTITVTIDADLLQKARDLNINISAASEKGVEAEVRRIEQERLKEVYREAAKEIGQVIKEDGLFSDGLRLF